VDFNELTSCQPYFDAEDEASIDALAQKRCKALLSVDDSYAGILQWLEEESELEHTYVLVTSDHGCAPPGPGCPGSSCALEAFTFAAQRCHTHAAAAYLTEAPRARRQPRATHASFEQVSAVRTDAFCRTRSGCSCSLTARCLQLRALAAHSDALHGARLAIGGGVI
jgi:hypothetical protein